jgi:hypothetical protein
MLDYWCKFSKFGHNRIKILAQIETSILGGRVGGGSKYVLKIPLLCTKYSNFVKIGSAFFFKLLKEQNFHFSPLGWPWGQLVDFLKFELLGC